MVLRPDQDRVRVMLKDTITLLCKNGLSFKTKFCIDAVIGVTLDDNDIFLVSMNEMVKSDKVNNDSDGASSDDSISSEQKRKRRRRIRNKRRSTESVESDVGQDPDEDIPEPSSMSKTRSPTKVAKIEQEEQEESQDDIMFIKQERSDEQWSQAASNMDFPDFSNLNSTTDGGDGHFPLSDMNLIPISQEGTSSTLQQYAAGPSSTKTFSTTAGNQSMSQLNWQEHNQSMVQGQIHNTSRLGAHHWPKKYSCEICGKKFAATTHLKGHMFIHTGVKDFNCDHCSKAFLYKSHLKRHMRMSHNLDLLPQRSGGNTPHTVNTSL